MPATFKNAQFSANTAACENISLKNWNKIIGISQPLQLKTSARTITTSGNVPYTPATAHVT